jgi:hypothetical protein
MPKLIELPSGLCAVVDDDDFNFVNQYRWQIVNGYAKTRIFIGRASNWKAGIYHYKYKGIYMHRFVMDAQPGQEIDHINRNKLDNRKANLRFCTQSQNTANSFGKLRKYSKYKGVTKTKGSRGWIAQIMVNYSQIYLGTFPTEKDAAIAYNEAAKIHFGEFAHINIIEM